MGVGVLMRKELRDILSERLYLLAFLVQLLIAVSITTVALMYASLSSPEVMESYLPPQQVKAGVVGDISLLQVENLRLVPLKPEDNYWELMESRGLVAVLVAPDNLSAALQQGRAVFLLYIDNTNPLSGFADAMLTRAVERLREQRSMAEVELSVKGRAPDAPPEFLQVMYGILLPFILLLPTFLAANMTTDSIVGEKERRTYELLAVAPLSLREVMLAKTLPVAAVALAQAWLWMLLLTLRGIQVHNQGLILLLLGLLDLLFIGAGVVISAVSDTVKEANAGVTMLLIFASLLLFAPVGGHPLPTPVRLIATLSSTPAPELGEVLVGILYLGILGALVLLLGERLLERRENLRL